MSSNESSRTARADSSWQEEAARVLLRSGFRPGHLIGQVEHVANTHGAGRTGRTFGSVWHAMRTLMSNEPERAYHAQDVDRSELLQQVEAHKA